MNGTVLGLVFGAALSSLNVTAAARPASSPQDQPDAQVWRGTYVVERCIRSEGAGPSYCRFVLGTRGRVELSIDTKETQGRFALLDGTGRVVATGTIGSLGGSPDLPVWSEAIRLKSPDDGRDAGVVTDWRTDSSATARSLTGSFAIHREFVSVFGRQTASETCRFVLDRAGD